MIATHHESQMWPMPEQPIVGNLCRVTGGAFAGRLGFLLAVEDEWARVKLSDGLLLLSSSLIEGI